MAALLCSWTPWLRTHLDHPDLRILDATTLLRFAEGDGYYDLAPALGLFGGHIPGAVHADLLHDLAVPGAPTAFTALDSAEFARRIGLLGVGDDHHVVVYDQGQAWATRLWWNFRLEGFTRVSVLDGGFSAWRDAGHPIRSEAETYPPARFTLRRQEHLIADSARVLEAADSPSGPPGSPLITITYKQISPNE